MRFAPPAPRRRPREAVVPMINVVFLLLVFFLMTATIAAPPPFDLTLPQGAAGEDAGAPGVLYVGADGTLAFGALRGEEALSAAAASAGEGALDIRADREAPGSRIARLLADLRDLGVTGTRLVTERP